MNCSSGYQLLLAMLGHAVMFVGFTMIVGGLIAYLFSRVAR